MIKENSIILDYSGRIRTLEETTDLLKTSLEIKRLKGKNSIWQVKLEKVYFYDSSISILEKGSKNSYLFIRDSNPNYALRKLCEKLSYSIVVTPDRMIIQLGEVNKGPFYIRIVEGM